MAFIGPFPRHWRARLRKGLTKKKKRSKRLPPGHISHEDFYGRLEQTELSCLTARLMLRPDVLACLCLASCAHMSMRDRVKITAGGVLGRVYSLKKRRVLVVYIS